MSNLTIRYDHRTKIVYLTRPYFSVEELKKIVEYVEVRENEYKPTKE